MQHLVQSMEFNFLIWIIVKLLIQFGMSKLLYKLFYKLALLKIDQALRMDCCTPFQRNL